jgi:hypothetical protein
VPRIAYGLLNIQTDGHTAKIYLMAKKMVADQISSGHTWSSGLLCEVSVHPESALHREHLPLIEPRPVCYLTEYVLNGRI